MDGSCSSGEHEGISRRVLRISPDRRQNGASNHHLHSSQQQPTHRPERERAIEQDEVCHFWRSFQAFTDNRIMDSKFPATATTMEEERQSVARPAEGDDETGGKSGNSGTRRSGGDNNDVAPAGDTASSSSSSSPPPPSTAVSAAAVAATSADQFENDNMRAKFDHSSRKVVVHNVLKFIKSKDVSKLTASWIDEYNKNSSNTNNHINIQLTNARKPPKDSWIKVTLAEESMVNPFIAFINSGGKDGKALVNERGRPLFAKRVDDMIEYDNYGGDGERKDDDGSTNNDKCQKKRKEPFQANDTNSNGVEDGNISNNDNDKDPNSKRFKVDSPQKLLSDDEVRDAITPLWRLSYEEQLTSKMRDMVNKCANKILKEIKGKFR